MPPLDALDKTLFDWINSGWGNPLFDLLMPAITRLAGTRIVWVWVVLIGLIACWRLLRTRKAAANKGAWRQRLKSCLLCLLYAFLVYGVTSGINSGLKDLFNRPRPFLQQTVQERLPPRMQTRLAQSGSFPSGHACNAFGIATLLAASFRRPRFLFYALAAMIGLSRIYLGVHYPSDVLAGGLIGWGVTTLLLRVPLLRQSLAGAGPPPPGVAV